jgi:hypothetical protein
MRFRISARSVLCALVLMGSLASSNLAEISGRSGRSKTFSGTAMIGTAESRFSITIEPVSFNLNSVAGKYKFIEISVENRSTTPVTLSSDQDRFEAVINGQTVQAILSLQRADSVLWDSFTAARRKDLAYPVRINAAAVGRNTVPEYVSLFVFLPADRTPDVPTEFHFTIASLGATVTLRKPPATGA